MASAGKKVAKAVPFSASDLASIKDNPYVHRVIEDAALRDNVYNVIESSRGAYEQLSSNGAPHKAVLEDSKLHRHVQSAAGSLRDIALALNDVDTKHNQPFKKKKKKRRGRKLLVLLIGAGVALAVSESLRNKLLDALFGKEEEFQYTPPAPAPTEPPASPVSAA
jgi:hypothetical protein